MATQQVYSSTTTTITEPKSNKWFIVPTENLDKIRCSIKVVEVLLSFVAFILEEVVTSCVSCGALYFFEFVSCTAFLFTLLLLILLSTKLHMRVGIECWPTLDFVYTAVIAFLFLIASCTFAADNGGSALETTAVAFGFLATVAFCVDAGMFVKTKGVPCKNNNKPPTSNGEAQPEAERLNGGTD